jgi:acylphosphatase
MALARRRFLVSGRVQGVFFRADAKRRADELGLAGYARNLPDGRVELVAEGDPDAIEHLARWAKEGSRRAHVTGVVATTEAPEGLTGFRTA